MIRIVSLSKAAAAGVAGAVAWELVMRSLATAGLPLFDIVRELGTIAFPHGPVVAWWSLGMASHALVGALWAIFYAYFFWSRFEWPPALQGLVFSLFPAMLALAIMVPQLAAMHAPQAVLRFDPIAYLASLGWRQPAGLLLGHLIFGLAMGSVYRRPVGYPAGQPPHLPTRQSRPRRRPQRLPAPRRGGDGFIFATGIECSYPTIEGGRWRCDQMHATGHYRRWQEDFELAGELGITHIRYGPPLHLICEQPGSYRWGAIDEPMAELRRHGPEPIVDLCHFGLPSWLGGFQDPDVPRVLAEYAGAFAARYPWVRYYTPVNEIYVCARLSALDGIWNEQCRDETAFVTAVRHMAMASALMSEAILDSRPDAIFVNGESGEFYQPCCPDPEVVRIADLENARRFLPLDLLYGHPVDPILRSTLREHGMSDREYDWFMSRTVPRRTILGVDYYEWNEKLIDREGHARSLGELFGWYVIASQYYDRYRRPMMHTETNRLDARDGPRWLWRQWHNVQLLRKAGVPLVGFTWYSLTDQVDWDIALAQPLGNVSPVGLFDLNRDLRPVGLAYRHLIDIHRDEPGFATCPALSELLD
jgi:beta-glucosidase/6-phospho-beta-glucosidase/beta-galactosidase